MDEMHARIHIRVRLPLQAEIDARRRLPAQAARPRRISAALIAQRVAGPFELGPQALDVAERRGQGWQAPLDTAEHRRPLAAEEAAEIGRPACADPPRPLAAKTAPDLAHRIADVAARAEPAPAEAERHVHVPEPLRRDDVLATVEPGADHVLQADGQCRTPRVLLPKAQLQVEGAVVGDAAAARRVQPVGEAEGGLQEGQGLEGEKPGVPLPAPGRAGLDGAVGAKPRVAHFDQAGAAEIAPRRGRLFRARRRGNGQQQCQATQRPAPLAPTSLSNRTLCRGAWQGGSAALVRRAYTRNAQLSSKFAYRLNSGRLD